MKQSKWPDFLFTLVVRLVCGAFVGGLACFIFTYRGILRAFSHNDTTSPLVWLAICAAVGGIVSVFTIPHWQTPWYKGIRDRNQEDD